MHALTPSRASCTMNFIGRLAQRLERSVYTRKVVRSNRTVPTITSKQLALRPLSVNGPIVRVLKALAPFLLPFFVGVASAQVTAPAQQAHKIKAPPRFNRRAFIAGVSRLATSGTADAITMRRLLDRGGVELTPVCGRYPSPAKQAGINAGIFAPQSFARAMQELIRARQ